MKGLEDLRFCFLVQMTNLSIPIPRPRQRGLEGFYPSFLSVCLSLFAFSSPIIYPAAPTRDRSRARKERKRRRMQRDLSSERMTRPRSPLERDPLSPRGDRHGRREAYGDDLNAAASSSRDESRRSRGGNGRHLDRSDRDRDRDGGRDSYQSEGRQRARYHDGREREERKYDQQRYDKGKRRERRDSTSPDRRQPRDTERDRDRDRDRIRERPRSRDREQDYERRRFDKTRDESSSSRRYKESAQARRSDHTSSSRRHADEDPSPPHSHSHAHSRRSHRSRSPRDRRSPPDTSATPGSRDEHLEAEAEADADADTPDMRPSGLLAQESNKTSSGTVLKYHEPPEARKPTLKWRLYVFKASVEVDLLHLSRQSCYLFGRDKTVVDIPVEHGSCSKQHAVIQFRGITTRDEFGDEKRNIKPFIIDLDSSNGTMVNSREIPASRYYELKNGDTVRFGASEREYVLLCETA